MRGMFLNKKMSNSLVGMLLVFNLLFLLSPVSMVYAQGASEQGQSESARQGSAFDAFNDAKVGCSNGLNLAKFFTLCLPMGGLYLSSKALFYSANFFDNFLFFSIESDYLRLKSIDNMWSSLRDVANLAFILGLIYISLTLILGVGGNKSKTFLVRLILIAVLLNFSLFISRVIIDAGNITALTFYNSISGPDIDSKNNFTNSLIDDKSSEKNNDTSTRAQSISGAVVQIFNPARMFDEGVFKNFVKESEGKIGFKLTLIISAFSVISIMTAIELFFAGFFFISRTIWLILLMVISPLAFVSYFIPAFSGKFKEWFTKLFERSFCLVPYIFAIWALILITGSAGAGISNSAKQTSGTPDSVLMIIILQFAIVYSVLKIARKQSSKMCEGGTGIMSNFVDKGIGAAKGLALGAATGGVGLAARTSIGRLGYKASTGQGAVGSYLENKAAEGSGVALFARNRLQNISNMSFGTTDGFKGKLTSSATKKVAVGNEVENLARKKKEKELKNIAVDKDLDAYKLANPLATRDQVNARKKKAEVNYRTSNQYGQDKAVADAYGKQKGTNTVAGQSKKGNDEIVAPDGSVLAGVKPAGILKRTLDSAINGFVPAADQGLKQRQGQFDTDQERKDKDERDKQKNADRTYEAELQKNKIANEAQRAIADIQKSTENNGEVFEVEDAIQKSEGSITNYIELAEDQFKDKNGNLSFENKAKVAQLEVDLRSQLKASLELSKRQQDDVRTKLKDDKKSRDDLKTISAQRKEEQEILGQIRQEISNNGEAALDNKRKEILAKPEYNIAVTGDSIDKNKLTEIGTAQAKAGSEYVASNQDFNEKIQEVIKTEKDLSDLQKQQRKDLSDKMNNTTKAVNARVDSKMKSDDAELFAAMNNRREEANTKKTGLDTTLGQDLDRNTTDLE